MYNWAKIISKILIFLRFVTENNNNNNNNNNFENDQRERS